MSLIILSSPNYGNSDALALNIVGATFKFVGYIFDIVGNVLWYSISPFVWIANEPSISIQIERPLVLYETSAILPFCGISGLIFGSFFIEDRDLRDIFQFSTFGLLGILVFQKLLK